MRPVRVRVVRRFPFPQAAAYAWLTDFEDADAQRAGAVVETRLVVARSPGRVVYEGETRVLGRRTWARTDVTLQPPDRWEARVTQGSRAGSETRYRLAPTPDGCELTVDYAFVLQPRARMLLLGLLKGLVKRDLERMWDGFEAAMRAELAA